MNKLTIGPAGNSEIFYQNGYKRTLQAPQFLKSIGLTGYEYSFGRGFTLGEDLAKQIGEEAKKNDITLSVHAPYYINFANPDDQMIQKSIGYVQKSLEYLDLLNAEKVVVHTASVGKMEREQALNRVKTTLQQCLNQVKQNCNTKNKYICLETMGKYMQIGTYEEIIDLCTMDDVLIPTFDFGHINCIMQGGLKTEQDYQKIFELCFEKLGEFKTKNCHFHFSKIEYSSKGEIKHLDLSDTQYGPEFEPLARVIKKLNLTPTIICESKNKMMEDALVLKQIYESI